MFDLSGLYFGRLKILSYAYSKNHRRYWNCVCTCGNECIKHGKYLKSGETKSCGCLVKEAASKNIKAGRINSSAIIRNKDIYENEKKHPAYITWKGMRARCYSKNAKTYRWYGLRGIKICEEWGNPGNFIEWCKLNGYKKGLHLDRINRDGDYEPVNCRFVTRAENLRFMHEALRKKNEKAKSRKED